jgi:hypothetical protein
MSSEKKTETREGGDASKGCENMQKGKTESAT